MTDTRRLSIGTAAFGLAGCLLLAGCGNSTSATQGSTPSVQAAAGATHAASTAPSDPASTGSTPAAAPASGTKACALVTQQEVGASLGKDPGLGKAFASHGASQCQYGTFQTAFVLVNLNPSQGDAAYDHMRNNPKVAQAGAVDDVAGLGDKAFRISGHGTASIYFTKDDALVLVMVEIRSATSPPKGQALALAKSAANRI